MLLMHILWFVPISGLLISTAVDAAKGATDLILEAGYPVEKHKVETPDGYILTLHRIPNPAKPAVLIMHGYLSSSSDFVVIGPEKGLAFLLFNQGYDVWLANARGNRFSRMHSYMNPDKDSKYWDFSWHEIGVTDIPTLIDFVLQQTNQDKLNYIGHSQGTTAFFVMASERPEYNGKIKSMHALAPVVYMTYVQSAIFTTLATSMPIVKVVTREFNRYEQLGFNSPLSTSLRQLCRGSRALMRNVCENLLFLNGGFDQKQINETILPMILEQIPAGGSYKQLFHFAQVYQSGMFRQYNYGPEINIEKYGSREPPAYNLKNTTAPVFLYHSDNDYLSDPKDVQTLIRKLGSIVGIYRVPDPEFTHHDFLYAIDVIPLLYNKLFEDIRKYT